MTDYALVSETLVAISGHLIHKTSLTRASAVTGAVTLIQRFLSAAGIALKAA